MGKKVVKNREDENDYAKTKPQHEQHPLATNYTDAFLPSFFSSLFTGCKNRQVRSHSMNENSSRSHAVMTITLSSETPDPDDPQVITPLVQAEVEIAI